MQVLCVRRAEIEEAPDDGKWDPPGSKRVTQVASAGCHSVGIAAAGWLDFGSECRCVGRAEIEEAPDDGK